MVIGAIIIFFAVFLDQLTKYLAVAFISDLVNFQNPYIVWIPQLLRVTYVENSGASFGMLEGQQLIFLMITILALGMFGYLFLSSDFKTKKTYSWAIALFIGGTIGNAIDRALLGYVIDFLNYPFVDSVLNFIGFRGFSNNLADMFLSAAIVLFAIDIFFLEPKRKKETSHE